TWLQVKVTSRETRTKDGEILRHDPPLVEVRREAHVVRGDGLMYGPAGDETLDVLPVELKVSGVPNPEHFWRAPPGRAYRDRPPPNAERSFAGVQAGVKWLSCEPLLERLTFSSLAMFDWVVIGGCSRGTQTPEFQPPWEWVEHLMGQARAAGCQIYVKPNL